jgi:16S rRNA processing protein RimM
MGLINYGKITRPHGLKGEVVLIPFSRRSDSLPGISHIYVERKNSREPEMMAVSAFRFQKGAAVVKLNGVDSIDDAEELRGAGVLVDTDELEGLEEDEYYWFELIGLQVYTEDGAFVGNVEDLIDRAEQSVLIVRNGETETLIPLAEPIIKEIDLESSKIVITPVDGLLGQK